MTDTPERHPTCNCHQCTWLRASQLERAFTPTPSMDTCNQMAPCNQPMNHPKGCYCQKPDPVEVKINDIKFVHAPNVDQWKLDEQLRELVRLAREK